MKRYVIKPKDWEGEWYNEPGPQPLTITVWEKERGPQKTGLLDKQGNELFSVNDGEPVGFVRFPR